MSTAAHRWLMTETGKPLVREDFQSETPAIGELTVEVAGCGVCHTDLGFLYDGVRTNKELPLTLGHEISGRVLAAGSETDIAVGQEVVIPAVIPCGHCQLCERGLGNICRSQKMPGNDIHGGFATHVTVPAQGICKVDPQQLEAAGMSLAEVAVLADAVTTPYQAAVLADIGEDDVAVVIGVGGVGGYAVQIAAAFGATVVAVDIDQAKLKALEDYGAALTLNAREHDSRALKKQIQGFVRGRGLRSTEWKVLECSGTAAGQTQAFGLLTFGGHLGIVGFSMEKTEQRLSNLMAFNARMQGNWGCLTEYYPQALDLVLSGKVQMKPFVELHPLDDVNAIFEAAHNHQLSKRAILVP